MLGQYSSVIIRVRNENPVFQSSPPWKEYSQRLLSRHWQNLKTILLVQSAPFFVISLPHRCELQEILQCKVKISTGRALWQFWGELVLRDKHKSLPLSLSSLPRNDRHPPGRAFHAPPPLIIQATSATTPFVQRYAAAHVDWWTHDPFFPFFLIPPYVGMAHMTSLLSHLLHPDTITHYSFFHSRLREWGGEAIRTSFSTSHKKKKNRPAGSSSSHSDDITQGWNRYTFSLFSPSVFSFFCGRLLWTLQIFLITLECWGRHRSQVI